jgi:hypothetical protein
MNALTASTRRPAGTASILAATAGAVGGLALFADLSLHAFGPLDRSYFVVATAMALCLLGVPARTGYGRPSGPGGAAVSPSPATSSSARARLRGSRRS